ncbi:MAG: alpha/beta hydrolase [Acidimicrobiales bacterium]
MTIDTHLGGQRPTGFGYWPLPEDDPGVAVERESIRLITRDGALVTGLLWTPPTGRPWKTAVILSHPRGDFSVHYACPLLAAAGYAVLGFGSRYMGNDTDCQHELLPIDVAIVEAEMRRRGAEAVVLLGNSGGGSMMAYSHEQQEVGDGLVCLAAHPGEGLFMAYTIDPSVADEHDPLSVVPELDMYHPDNGWRPWPEPSRYDPAWLEVYRAAQLARIDRIDAMARAMIDDAAAARRAASALDRQVDPLAWRRARARGVTTPYLVIYRTLANPTYLDLTIEPDDRPMGSLFAVADPLDGNYGRAGLARTMTPRGWLSTWSASSPATLKECVAKVALPTLIVHPTADTEVRISWARDVYEASAATDKEYVEIAGAPHYLEGHRPEAMAHVADWLAARFP